MRSSSPTGIAGTEFISPSAQQFLTLTIYTVAIFMSALLLFVVQPMFAKVILPVLGGAPAVWAVAMVFFQSALLLGYAYAHGLTWWCPDRFAPLVHIGVMVIGGLLLPLGIASGWGEPPTEGVHLWVFGLFAVSIGLPFVAMSANGPLLQAWFSRTGHPHARDPYFLYASSNIGSLLALLAYPVLLEPTATLHQQTGGWSYGYWTLTFVLGMCGLVMVSRFGAGDAAMSGAVDGVSTDVVPDADEGDCVRRISARDRAFWIGLAAIPSALMIGVTNHMTMDVAAVPFLWVLPLALFLLTFIIVYQRKPIVPHRAMRLMHPFAAVVLLLVLVYPIELPLVAEIGVHLGAFFIFTMVCHGELARRRPAARHLTQYYLFMSLGGMLGGLLAGLIAPNVFSTALEYPIAIALSLFAARVVWAKERHVYGRELAGFAIVLAVIVLMPTLFDVPGDFVMKLWFFLLVGMMPLIFFWRYRALRLALTISLAFIATVSADFMVRDGVDLRGFYGIHSVRDLQNGKFRALIHGTTVHGLQLNDDPVRARTGRPQMFAYYHEKSGFADTIRSVQERRTSADKPASVGVIGLGAGALACYRQPNEAWTFFEIDPLIARIARDKSMFTFLSDCAPNAPIVLGDARLTLTRQKDAAFDLLVVDAFSSDTVPAHLLTLEAMKVYLNKLTTDGVLLMHISNRYSELRPVLGAAARELGLKAVWSFGQVEAGMEKRGLSLGLVVALSRDDTALQGLQAKSHWNPIDVANRVPWSDDYSNMLGAILAKKPYKELETTRAR